jgi:acyl-CoA thioesterase-1
MKGSLLAQCSIRYGALRARSKAFAHVLRAGVAVLALAGALSGAATAQPVTKVSAQPVTIAALGDSLTHGFGLSPRDAFPAQLEQWLRARGHDVTIINAGVSGDTTAGGLSRMDWTLTPDVDAMIVELGGNDLLRGMDPAASRSNLDAILARLAAEGLPALIAGLPAPGNYGADWKRDFAMFPELAEKYGAILYPNFLVAIAPDMSMTNRAMREAAGALMQADGIHPNAGGVARIVEDIGPAVEILIARTARGGG